MKYYFVVIFIDLLFIDAQSLDKRVINYCGAKMCERTNTHTFCQFSPGPSPECMGYIEAELSMEEKARIVARLNRRRSEAAWGSLRKLPTAGNMVKLRWVEELAREAQRWADQCRPPRTPEENDICRDLYSITVGQCVSSVLGEAPGLRVESLVDMWYMQAAHYKGNVTSYIPSFDQTNFYGDFAQIMWSRTYMVGCGRSRFMTPWHGRLRSVERLVCNFAPRGPVPLRSLWLPTTPATACPARSRPDAELQGLCNYRYDLDETDDVDNTMTREQHTLLNIIFETEGNESLNYIGSLDELYLTRTAIATMSNTVMTVSSNNSGNRINLFIPVKSPVDLMNDLKETIEVYDKNTTNLIPNETTVILAMKKKKKMKLIGRPKSYNLGELNYISPNNVEENDFKTDNTLRDVSSKQKHLYVDYDFFETPEENVTSNWMEITTTEFNVNTSSEDYENENFVHNATLNNGSIENITTTSDAFNHHNLTVEDSTNIMITEKSFEDYLSDPETIRQLEEALKRVESNLAKTTMISNLPVKVHRVLRDLKTDDTMGDETLSTDESSSKNEVSSSEKSNETEQDIKTDIKEPTNQEERNKTLDSTPMLNMVLRYMPYLKPAYESSVLGSATNKAVHSLISPSVLLVFVLRF